MFCSGLALKLGLMHETVTKFFCRSSPQLKCLFVQEHFSLGTSRLEKSSAKLKYTFRIRNCVEVEFSKQVIAS